MTGPTPHILTHILDLVQIGRDPGLPKRIDYGSIFCPHSPSPTMPCAMHEPCGCVPVPYESDDLGYLDEHADPRVGHVGSGPCPWSATGAHHYFEGGPQRPTASCGYREWESEITDEANLGWNLDPGRYAITTVCCDGVPFLAEAVRR